MILAQARLSLERGEELFRLRERFPDAGQERRPVRTVLEDEAVDSRSQLRKELGLRAAGQGLGGRQDREMDLEIRALEEILRLCDEF